MGMQCETAPANKEGRYAAIHAARFGQLPLGGLTHALARASTDNFILAMNVRLCEISASSVTD